MTIDEIKAAVRSGKRVCLGNDNYEVKLHLFRSGEEQWLITCHFNQSHIGLTNVKGDTLNGRPEHFFILP